MRRLALVVVLFLAAASAFAQAPQPAQLAWVRYFNVDIAKGEEWAAYQMKSTGAVFDRLMAEGKIAGWGMGQPLVLSGQDYTHSIWVRMPNWSGSDAIVAGFESAMKNMTPAQLETEMKMMSAVKAMPRDVVIRHLSQTSVAPASTAPPKYLRITYYTINPARFDDALALWREVEPTYADLAKRGVISAYGFSTQEVITDPSWTHMVWFYTSELANFDEVRNAVMSLPAYRTMMLRLRDMSDPTKVRGEVLSVRALKSPLTQRASK